MRVFGFAGVAALVYGIVSSRPPLLFLTANGLCGATFAAIIFWGNRRKRTFFAVTVAFSLFLVGHPAIERAFFGRGYNTGSMPWPAYFAELGAFALGFAVAFSALTRFWKAIPEDSKSGVQ
jgi:hypothetical protein